MPSDQADLDRFDLAILRVLQTEGRISAVELARRIGVPPWKLKDLSRQSRGWSAPGVARAIQHAAAADAAVKGASGDPDYALESLVLSVIDCRSRARHAPAPSRR